MIHLKYNSKIDKDQTRIKWVLKSNAHMSLALKKKIKIYFRDIGIKQFSRYIFKLKTDSIKLFVQYATNYF